MPMDIFLGNAEFQYTPTHLIGGNGRIPPLLHRVFGSTIHEDLFFKRNHRKMGKMHAHDEWKDVTGTCARSAK